MEEKLSCLLRLDEEDLSISDLQFHQKKLWKDFENGFIATLVIIRSNFGKKFAFFIPTKFEE